MAKDDPPTFILPWKMPDLHLIRDSPTPRSTWVAQTYQCGWEAFECLPRGSNKICTKNLNKHNGGEARSLWELGWEENVGAGGRMLTAATALSSKTFISLHCLLPQHEKMQNLGLFTVWDFREDQKKVPIWQPFLLQNRQVECWGSASQLW